MPVSTQVPLPNSRLRDLPAAEQEVKHFSMGGVYLRQGDLRLDGSFYSEDAWLARALVQETAYDEIPLGGDDGLADVWMPGRFKRIEVSDPELGVPFLTPSEIFQAKPPVGRYLSKAQTSKLESYVVDKGWILVTRSGVVGRAVMVSETLQGTAVSEDAIRVVARDGVPPGYVYAYLTSFIGGNLTTKDQYGAVIKHIEPFHVAQVPVPLLPPSLQQSIHDDIVEAYRLRDEANDLLDQADELLYSELGLPRLHESQVRYYSGGDVKVFQTRSDKLNLRLDARYSRPIVQLIEDNLDRAAKDRGFEVKTLADATADVFIPARFKRTYVEDKYGVPFLQGAHIVQFKPFDVKHISRSLTENLETYILDRNWTLVTCSGTLGRTSFVGSDTVGWAATQHVMRVVPDTSVIDAGYLHAFLSSGYGYWQIVRNRYGAVVDEIAAEQVTDVLVPYPSQPLQKRIGGLVIKAYDNRAKANGLENQAIKLLEDTLVEAYQKRTGRRVAVR